MDTKSFLYLAVIIVVGVIVIKILRKFKVPKLNTLTLIDGGVKVGKSTFTVYLGIKTYRKIHFRWKVVCFFRKMLKRDLPEEPLLYSNIPLGVDYVPLTHDLITRKTRYRFGSVIIIDEASLLHDKFVFSNKTLSERVNLYYKLIGHELHGGSLIVNTHTIDDLPKEQRNCLADTLYIYDTNKLIPFFLCARVREERYSEAGGIVNNYDADVEDSLKKVLISKRTWKKFDAYAFSFLTDNLPVEDRIIHGAELTSLKATTITSFNSFTTIDEKYLSRPEVDYEYKNQ